MEEIILLAVAQHMLSMWDDKPKDDHPKQTEITKTTSHSSSAKTDPSKDPRKNLTLRTTLR